VRPAAVILALTACSFQPPSGGGATPGGDDGNASDDGGASSDGQAAPTCPDTYKPLPGAPSLYRLSGDPGTARGTWLEAEADCRDDGTGTHLAIPETELEHEAFVDVLSGASRWLGVSDRRVEGEWIPIIGGTTWVPHWYNGMPYRGVLGNCLLLVSNVTEEDTPCMGEGTPPSEQWDKGYVCECDGKPVDQTTF